MHPPRIRKLARLLPPYFSGATEVLDVGSGDGKLAACLALQVPARFVGCDTVLQPSSAIEVIQYDGSTLPFADNAFQYVMLIDMLHHVHEQQRMLSEARRVAREFLVIKDHYWETRFDRTWLAVIDYVGNAGLGVDVPYQFLKEEQWDALFRASELEVLQCTKMRWSRLDPIRQVVFKLKKR
jgi:SAM-dependent methyltransferase